ncbi:5956_t:CDS:2 [Paraglomus brasilianum]|uniref:5956_t:CDS:1 n=1 Tax=Paraglomus brasilianum TaxID=144538 RepID=A0A9N8VYP1_9GLOM|nr:5956_t:CDS:2 [Paraglomus brasilianum]
MCDAVGAWVEEMFDKNTDGKRNYYYGFVAHFRRGMTLYQPIRNIRVRFAWTILWRVITWPYDGTGCRITETNGFYIFQCLIASSSEERAAVSSKTLLKGVAPVAGKRPSCPPAVMREHGFGITNIPTSWFTLNVNEKARTGGGVAYPTPPHFRA